MIYAARSETGKRYQNQDVLFVPSRGEVSLFIVADGMGGHNAGSVASRLATDTVEAEIKKGGASTPDTLLLNAVGAANRAVLAYADSDRNCRGMGTTMVAALVFQTKYVVANVGDSRLYQMADGILHQVTRDHSYVAELVAAGEITPAQAAVHPRRNIITRALGTRNDERIDIFKCEWARGDILLLCSDGLYGSFDDREMARILNEADDDLDLACDTLVQEALYNGSTDNISVILIKNKEVR